MNNREIARLTDKYVANTYARYPIALVRGWYANGDIAGLRQFLPGVHMSVPGQRALTTYIRLMVENEGSAPVMSWAESLPDEDDKSFKLTVFRRVVNVLAQLDVQAAARWCEAHCDGPYGNNLRSLIARNWALRDGPAAPARGGRTPEGARAPPPGRGGRRGRYARDSTLRQIARTASASAMARSASGRV